METFKNLFEKEDYYLDMNLKMKDGRKSSDRQNFDNRKEALKILNDEREGKAGLDYDNIKDLSYFNDEETFTVIQNGKLFPKKLK